LTGLSALTSVGGYLQIQNNAVLTSLTGLSTLTSVGGYLQIRNNAVLTSLTGLSALTSIGGTLAIQNNAALTNLTGLSALTSVGGYLQIEDNAVLTSLTGLSALTSGGALSIQNNAALTNLTGLSPLTSIAGELIINNNDALASLSGLNNIAQAGITNLFLQNSTILSVCNVPSICAYLAIVPARPATISANATGCATRPQVVAACLALPIELLDFTARLVGPATRLHWTTSIETNNQGFFIERSPDGTHWETLGFVAGRGNSTAPVSYSFPDEKPLPGLNYYRLRQLDFDGGEAFFPIVQVTLPDRSGQVRVYPNPVMAGTDCTVNSLEEILSLRLLDATGRPVEVFSSLTHFGIKALKPGIYWLEVLTEQWTGVEKVVVR